MINIYCSTKLSNIIKPEKFTLRNSDAENDWSAHLFPVAGRKCVIFVNKETLYSVVLIDILKKDLLNLQVIFTEFLIKQLEINKMLTPKYENFIRENNKIMNIYTTDNDRKTMGSLNDFISHIKASYDYSGDLDKAKKYVVKYLNTMPSKVLKFHTPNDMMIQKIKNYG
ncbi:hypothetical protein NAT47_07155 [Flavobacterium sp. HXWNR69]|uniref:DUF6933 domain-containing protein n=2 Tax=Flavobacterium TaxID=237 RepID=V6SA45_9FLAO|nr:MULTISPECIES: hypothetical protein [Flavobacterium]ESU21260.1 hypothetical protein FCR2A7T_06880 [Flavobacterium cauense R2A-7]KGO79020.1 hypothetical protein Q762_14725 [Flavobacterium cauense R2A-7]MCL9770190.1 hypothetical protein [Flavobacterium sp. HXWNR69]TWI07391.1 hypothetical protein IP98_02949 [Flavobacterium cauense R2A-7]